MPDLDFTALKKIAYQGFKTEQDKDTLIDQGFTILQGEKTPFETPEPPPSPDPPHGSPAPQPPPMSEYKRAFRLAFDFLQQHTPAQHSADYWTQTTQDAAAITAQRPGDHLLMDLLLAVYAELERQCKAAITAEPVQGGLDREA